MSATLTSTTSVNIVNTAPANPVLETIQPKIDRIPQHVVNNIFKFLKPEEAPKIALASKTMQQTTGTFCLQTFNSNPNDFFKKEDDFAVFQRCGLQLTQIDAMVNTFYSEMPLANDARAYLNTNRGSKSAI